MPEQRFPQLAHWGAYTAVVKDGRLVRCEPFERDRHPSPMLHAIPEMVYSPLRIARPAVRELIASKVNELVSQLKGESR